MVGGAEARGGTDGSGGEGETAGAGEASEAPQFGGLFAHFALEGAVDGEEG